jgi:hypothetical protein
MWLGWLAWLRQIVLSNNLSMSPNYQILVSPDSTTKARLFLTNAVIEHEFLMFASSIDQMMQNWSRHTTMTALGGSQINFKQFLNLV